MASLETCVLWNYFNTTYSYRNWTWRSNSWVYIIDTTEFTCNVFTDPSINFILRCLTLVLYSSMSWKQRKSLLPIWTCTIETLRLKDENNYEYEIWFILFSSVGFGTALTWTLLLPLWKVFTSTQNQRYLSDTYTSRNPF